MKRGPGRPTKGYRTAAGKRVPSVTTITKRFQNSGGLIRWAYQRGLDGEDMDEVRDRAADAGSVAHDMIEAHIHGAPYDPPPNLPPEIVERGRVAFGAFLIWRASTNIEFLATETPLVSEAHLFGGTYDLKAIANKVLALLDWKSSSKGPYVEFLIQLGGYAILIEECEGDRVEEGYILRVGREFGNFSHHYYPRAVMELARETFLDQRRMYERDKQLQKAL